MGRVFILHFQLKVENDMWNLGFKGLLHILIYTMLDKRRSGPTLYKCYTNVLSLQGGRTFSQTLYIFPIVTQFWASVGDVDLALKQRWVSVSLELYP